MSGREADQVRVGISRAGRNVAVDLRGPRATVTLTCHERGGATLAATLAAIVGGGTDDDTEAEFILRGAELVAREKQHP